MFSVCVESLSGHKGRSRIKPWAHSPPAAHCVSSQSWPSRSHPAFHKKRRNVLFFVTHLHESHDSSQWESRLIVNCFLVPDESIATDWTFIWRLTAQTKRKVVFKASIEFPGDLALVFSWQPAWRPFCFALTGSNKAPQPRSHTLCRQLWCNCHEESLSGELEWIFSGAKSEGWVLTAVFQP